MAKGESGFGKTGGSSRISGLDVTLNGETTRYYFTQSGGQNYYQRGVDGTPEPTPGNMTAAEFRQRVEQNGAAVKTVSEQEKKKEKAKRKAYRKEMNDLLNRSTVNAESRKGTRADRISRRFRGGR